MSERPRMPARVAEERPIPELGTVPARIRAGIPALHPSEQRVAAVFLDRPDWTIEASAQEVADAAQTSRATVVRTAQRLGFTGYPQLRVLLARDVGSLVPARDAGIGDGRRGDDAAALVRDYVADVGGGLDLLAASLRDSDVERAVDLLHRAKTVMVIGTGLSEPIALEAAMRLNAIGVVADSPSDRVLRGSRARALTGADVCLGISGSGSTRDTVQPVRAAAATGARVIALTAMSRSPLAELAEVRLVASMGESTSLGLGSFRDNITRTPRLSQTILVNALVHALIARDPQRAQAAQNRMLEVIGDAFAQDPN